MEGDVKNLTQSCSEIGNEMVEVFFQSTEAYSEP